MSGAMTRIQTKRKIQRRSSSRSPARTRTAGGRRSRRATAIATAATTPKLVRRGTMSASLPATGERALDAENDAQAGGHHPQGRSHENGALGRILGVLHDPVG